MEPTIASHALADNEAAAASLIVESNRGAVNRTASDVDSVKWASLLFVSSFVRWSLWHPFRLAMLRERTNRSGVNPLNIIKEAYAAHGVRGLFRGVGFAAGGNALGETAYIGLFEWMRHEDGPISGLVGSSVLRDSIAGTSADVFNVFLAAPFDVIASRQMTAGYGIAASLTYASGVKTAKGVWRTHGTRGFFAGTVPSLMYSPSSAMWWAMYEPLKKWMYDHGSGYMDTLNDLCGSKLPMAMVSRDDNMLFNAGAGVTASVFCTAAYNPILVVATRLQVGFGYSTNASGVLVRETYCGSTVMWVLRDLWKQEGVRGLLKGMKVNLGMAVGEGLLFSQMYEITKWLADPKG